MKKSFISAILKVAILCMIIFFGSAFFIYEAKLIGWVMLGLSALCLASLRAFQIPLKHVSPDIIFGVIDNSFLVVLALFGAHISGVAGAIIGGAVGNAITDGIAGVFEGHMAESLRQKNISEERTVLGSAIGKMAGCLLGAGVVLVCVNLLNISF
ncbi:hypothetical protein A3I41_01135 [Candidatus Uhrbacteria bacterium RIFCSPLOWO2_02_FULL_48_18]|uniref:Uncharacterized protein n=1 Tax=Candidatus Uhrbacteria bacterium RIFCSPLOWO2_02_FULL_48_18 TaxID=1802408 RepID=A0A1F7V8X6_9BACT|nr:MAG: hypothetical protein A2839_04180 [Candidatus Uhrbacteria bacterium RIFCSPHIGHO2_01_FULL_47_10]OGL82267.1 MAG: hypothetical protein A3B20_00755 [Candidatus Uhrbacteria bacterium RIFCSPLOWO2_01_FULL_47_17]OGL86865.1 MAG: hypothetical protein A3I41_01135 [Candidatus Uhrbacteria bacterium RIFCSPLOWO2_02_FULL_48_18]OGL94137.1 MAG: hypothetical protein A3H12_00930 [Candidatus Uhrbacteria bacterium RIFCSPLOWO2_12_FULL_47_9]